MDDCLRLRRDLINIEKLLGLSVRNTLNQCNYCQVFLFGKCRLCQKCRIAIYCSNTPCQELAANVPIHGHEEFCFKIRQMKETIAILDKYMNWKIDVISQQELSYAFELIRFGEFQTSRYAFYLATCQLHNLIENPLVSIDLKVWAREIILFPIILLVGHEKAHNLVKSWMSGRDRTLRLLINSGNGLTTEKYLLNPLITGRRLGECLALLLTGIMTLFKLKSMNQEHGQAMTNHLISSEMHQNGMTGRLWSKPQLDEAIGEQEILVRLMIKIITDEFDTPWLLKEIIKPRGLKSTAKSLSWFLKNNFHTNKWKVTRVLLEVSHYAFLKTGASQFLKEKFGEKWLGNKLTPEKES